MPAAPASVAAAAADGDTTPDCAADVGDGGADDRFDALPEPQSDVDDDDDDLHKECPMELSGWGEERRASIATAPEGTSGAFMLPSWTSRTCFGSRENDVVRAESALGVWDVGVE